MPANFIPTLRREIANLEAELADDPRFVKLKGLREVLALYENQGAEQASGLTGATPARTLTRKPSEAREKALSLSFDYISRQEGPVPTKQVYQWITDHGAEISGSNPINNLSAMLSNSPLFRSKGRSGWMLSEAGVDWLAQQERQAREDADEAIRATFRNSESERQEDEEGEQRKHDLGDVI